MVVSVHSQQYHILYHITSPIYHQMHQNLFDTLRQHRPQSMQSTYLIHHLAEAHALITATHSKIPSLFSSNRLHELSVLLQSLEHRVKLYYKFTSVHSEDLDAIRRINKLRKRNEIIIMHNRAVLAQKQGHSELALDLRTAILQELGSVIEGEQTRYGFLEAREQEQRGAALTVIAFWKREMVRHYYLLAEEAYRQGNYEIALAGLMKGLDLIREGYQRELHAARNQLEQRKTNKNHSYSQKLCHFQQVEQLFLSWQLSKYLNIVSSNTLTEFAASLSKDIPHNNGYNPPEFCMLQSGRMWDLDLPLIEEVIAGIYDGPSPVDQLEANKMAHYMYLGLLGKVQSEQNRQTESEYLKLKNAKNVVFLHVLQALLAKKYIRNCRHTQEVLQEMQNLYRAKGHHQKQHQTIYSLVEVFGLTPQSLSEHSLSQQEVSIIHMNAHTKQAKKLKKIKSNSKPKSKSKPKGKAKFDKKAIPQKQKKNRVKQQYMLKKDCKATGKPSMDHLLKAINQNYRSFDSSRSKDKHSSPFRRAIRTETCILDQNAHRNQERKAQTGQVHKKMH